MLIRVLVLMLSSLGVLAYTTYAQAECTSFTVEQVDSVRVPLIQLLKVTDTTAEDGDVDEATSKNIAYVKKALTALVDERMACETKHVDLDVLKNDLATIVDLSSYDQGQAIFGYGLQFHVQKPTNNNELLLVQISFGIPCGDDNILLGYRYRDNAWHRDLLWQSDEYQQISGAYGEYYNYLVLPYEYNESPKVVVIHGLPWCTSAWGQLKLDVVKLADVVQPQKVLLSQTIDYFMDNDNGSVLHRRDGGFELKTMVGMRDTDLLIRKGFYRYQVKGDDIQRIQPVADNGRDFVDAWLTTDSVMARRLSAEKSADQLMALHKSLLTRYGYYGSVRRCQGKEPLYQVEMTFNGTESSDKEETRYFIIEPASRGFLMKSSSNTANPDCTGPDITVKH